MKFLFRLENVLSWKRTLEDHSQVRLVQKREKLRRQEEDIQSLMHHRFEIDRRVNERLKQNLPAGDYLISKQFNEESYDELVEKEHQKKETEKEIDRELEKLKGFMKERKMLEKIKEKRFEKYVYQEKRLEQKNMDDRVIGKYRSSSGGGTPPSHPIKTSI